MIPIEPANEVSRVLVFLVLRLLKLRESAVRKDMEALPRRLWIGSSGSPSSGAYTSESDWILPSRSLTTRVA